MKKYTRPELSISKFDVEDIITTSGVAGSDFGGGTLYYDQNKDNPLNSNDANTSAVVYFNW